MVCMAMLMGARGGCTGLPARGAHPRRRAVLKQWKANEAPAARRTRHHRREALRSAICMLSIVAADVRESDS